MSWYAPLVDGEWDHQAQSMRSFVAPHYRDLGARFYNDFWPGVNREGIQLPTLQIIWQEWPFYFGEL